MESTELKKCPFCGGNPNLDVSFGDWSVTCEDCGCKTPWFMSIDNGKERAIMFWNRRVDDGNGA